MDNGHDHEKDGYLMSVVEKFISRATNGEGYSKGNGHEKPSKFGKEHSEVVFVELKAD